MKFSLHRSTSGFKNNSQKPGVSHCSILTSNAGSFHPQSTHGKKNESDAALLARLTRELAKPRVSKSVREEGKMPCIAERELIEVRRPFHRNWQRYPRKYLRHPATTFLTDDRGLARVKLNGRCCSAVISIKKNSFCERSANSFIFRCASNRPATHARQRVEPSWNFSKMSYSLRMPDLVEGYIGLYASYRAR